MTQVIRRLDKVGAREIEELSDVLIACVEGGASVGFLAPLSRAKAAAYWQDVAESVERDERVLLVATHEPDRIVGTVQVLWAKPENQPHRGDVAKMLVAPDARARGIGAALLSAAEREAARRGKTLLVLDTADATAARLYARGGWIRCGEIPRYAVWPHGGFCSTTVFFKSLADADGARPQA